MPNEALHQTGHAIDGDARHDGFSRVGRLVSLLFGGGGHRLASGARVAADLPTARGLVLDAIAAEAG